MCVCVCVCVCVDIYTSEVVAHYLYSVINGCPRAVVLYDSSCNNQTKGRESVLTLIYFTPQNAYYTSFQIEVRATMAGVVYTNVVLPRESIDGSGEGAHSRQQDLHEALIDTASVNRPSRHSVPLSIQTPGIGYIQGITKCACSLVCIKVVL